VIYRAEKKKIKAYNVIGMIPGEDKKEIMLVTHYDSPFCQGADDNGSGTAALLEVARVLSKYKFKHPIYFVFTDGEEQGFYGAYDYLNRHKNDIKDATVFNADGVGYGEAKDLYVGVDFKIGNKTYLASKNTDKVVADVAKIILGVSPKPYRCDYQCMDSYAFKEAGIETTNIISGNLPYEHTSLDTLANINKDFLTNVVKIMTVSTYRLAGGKPS
jgi:Zn-dependent M28 family amino/carboxypeptidase